MDPDGEQVPLPAEMYAVLRQAIGIMRQGMAVVVAPQGLVLTTQEAADFLGVRPSGPSRAATIDAPVEVR